MILLKTSGLVDLVHPDLSRKKMGREGSQMDGRWREGGASLLFEAKEKVIKQAVSARCLEQVMLAVSSWKIGQMSRHSKMDLVRQVLYTN